MLTAIYSLEHVYGADVWVAFISVCAVLYLGGCSFFHRNRRKRGIRTVLLGLLAAEVICDGVWAVCYYPGGEYCNYGIGSAYGLLLWPGLLCLAGFTATMINAKE